MNLGNWIDKRGQILDDNTKSRQLRESMGPDSTYNADTEVYIVSRSSWVNLTSYAVSNQLKVKMFFSTGYSTLNVFTTSTILRLKIVFEEIQRL